MCLIMCVYAPSTKKFKGGHCRNETTPLVGTLTSPPILFVYVQDAAKKPLPLIIPVHPTLRRMLRQQQQVESGETHILGQSLIVL